MSRTQKLMHAMRIALERLAPAISKATYDTRVTVAVTAQGFDIIALWRWPDGSEGRYVSSFDRDRVLGPYKLSPVPLPCQSPCGFRREIVREILNVRLGRV